MFAGQQAQVLRTGAGGLGRFNAAALPRPALEAEKGRQLAHLGLGRNPPEPVPEALRARCEQAAAWLVPHLARADLLAQRLQRQFTAASTAMFAIAAAAVAAVTIQDAFWPGSSWGAAIEIPLLLALLAIPATRGRHRLHERWITHRYLAERLRSAYFLTLAGTGDHANRTHGHGTDASAAWAGRALAQLAATRPPPPGPLDTCELRQYLAARWITSQARYHAAAAARHARRDAAYRRAAAALYAATLAAAAIHLVDSGHAPRLAALLVTISICAPAIGAAVHGIATQRTHRHHGQRSARTAALLTLLARQMDHAQNIRQIRQAAADTEQLIRQENDDWFGVMRFHDIELIT